MNIIELSNKKWKSSEIYSKDGRFQLYFHPVRYLLYVDSLKDPEDYDMLHDIGLYLLRKTKENVYEAEIFIGCDNLDWYSAECEMLKKIEEMPYSDEEREYLTDFIWEEMTTQTRVKFEREE